MQPQRLADDLAGPLARVERGVGVLEDHLHLAPQRPHLPPREAGDLAPVEADRARGRLDQLQDRAAERRLAAARLADQAERLAAPDAEADAVDRADLVDLAVDQEPAPDREVLDEVGDLEQRGAVRLIARSRRLQADPALDLAQLALLLRRRASSGRGGSGASATRASSGGQLRAAYRRRAGSAGGRRSRRRASSSEGGAPGICGSRLGRGRVEPRSASRAGPRCRGAGGRRRSRRGCPARRPCPRT